MPNDTTTSLTAKEKATLDYYNANALKWSNSHSIDRFWGDAFDDFQKLLPTGKIVDIGCGSGRDGQTLIEMGYDYTGIDISSELLKIAKAKNPKGKFIKKSIYDMDTLDTKQFDGFWCSTVLLHIPKTRINEALQAIKKAIKPEAIGFISVKRGENERVDTEGKYKRYTFLFSDKEMRKFLAENKLEVVKFKQMELNERATFLIYIVKSKS